MEKLLSAADANRNFSRLLQGVREGRTYVVTSHGKPVAQIGPAGKDAAVASGARAALLARLERQPAIEVERWSRDELYDDRQ